MKINSNIGDEMLHEAQNSVTCGWKLKRIMKILMPYVLDGAMHP